MWPDSVDAAVLVLNFSYVLIALALILRDILWLRAAWTGGQVFMILYGVLSNEPVILAWNSFFLAINGFQVARIILDRRDVRLSEELEHLYEKVFPLMSKHEFLKFWNTGQVREITDEGIVSRGELQEQLYLIVKGKVSIKKGDRQVARLGEGCFFAEMSFLTGMPAAADVAAMGTVKYNAWQHAQLRHFRDTDPQLYIKIQSAVSQDLVRKMQHELAEGTLF